MNLALQWGVHPIRGCVCVCVIKNVKVLLVYAVLENYIVRGNAAFFQTEGIQSGLHKQRWALSNRKNNKQ